MPDPPLAEQFHDLLDFADSQVRAGLRATGFFRIAGLTLKVTAPADLLAAVADPLAHLACMEAPAVITWHLFRKDTFFCRGVPARGYGSSSVTTMGGSTSGWITFMPGSPQRID